MDSIRINVLESYDLKFCCVCVQNGDISYLNVFENVISYQNVYISLAQIINDTLALNVLRNSSQPQEICVNCKTKVVDFFIFKRRNEETRRIFETSTSPKNILLQVVEQLVEEPESQIKEEYFESHEDIADEEDSMHEDFCDAANDVIVDDCHDDESLIETAEIEPEEPSEETKPKIVRKANPETWKRNTRKLAKNTGQSYVASNGKLVEAKRMKDNCGASCRMQCVKKISESSRLSNFQAYYNLADIAKQRKFLFQHMKTYEPRRNKTSPSSPKKSRNVQRNYFLDVMHPNGAEERVQVCRLLFLNTFCISSQMIDTLHKKAFEEGKFCDIRGKFERKGLRKQRRKTIETDNLQLEEPS